MELFTQLFGGLLLFAYHCFDRIVINGYLSGWSRPEQVVHFFRQAAADRHFNPQDQMHAARRLATRALVIRKPAACIRAGH